MTVRVVKLDPHLPRLLTYLTVAAALLSGCACRSIDFVSEPPGAIIEVDSRQCTTPCTMQVGCDSGEAIFTNQADDQIFVKIPRCDMVDNFKHETAAGAEKVFKAISVPFAAIGVIGLSIIGDDTDNDESTHRDTFLITAGALAVAAVFYTGGEMFNYLKERQASDSEIRVKFEMKPANKGHDAELGPALDSFNLKEADLKRLFPVTNPDPSDGW